MRGDVIIEIFVNLSAKSISFLQNVYFSKKENGFATCIQSLKICHLYTRTSAILFPLAAMLPKRFHKSNFNKS